MSLVKAEMPVLARHEGIWEGWYRYYDVDGEMIDQHRSRLVCRFPETGPHHYLQSNVYTWEDGRTECREFAAQYADGRLLWDTELVRGWAAELQLDEHRRTVILHWTRKNDPATYLYEMINTSDDGQRRARVWQWLESGNLKMRTLIDEVKVG